MFIEFEGTFLLVKVMSNSADGKLRWREDRQEVFIYRKNGKKVWKAATEAIQKDLKSQEILIRDYTNLIGTSSRQRRRPMMKVLVLEGSTIDPGNNPEYLHHDVPGHTYLNIKANSNVFVFTIEGLVMFLATTAIRKYFKENPEMGGMVPIEKFAPEEEDKRMMQFLYTLGKIQNLGG